MKYVHADQLWVWGLFCFLGMFLNVNLAPVIILGCTDLQGLAAGAYQAEYLSKIWPGFWFLTLFNGFWILFKTQLGNTDILVRTITDAVWNVGSKRAREWQMGIRAIYYGILVVFSVWGVIVIRRASPFQLFKDPREHGRHRVALLPGIQIFLVNWWFLPKAVRAPLWREIGLLACSAFYAFFAYFVVRDLCAVDVVGVVPVEGDDWRSRSSPRRNGAEIYGRRAEAVTLGDPLARRPGGGARRPGGAGGGF